MVRDFRGRNLAQAQARERQRLYTDRARGILHRTKAWAAANPEKSHDLSRALSGRRRARLNGVQIERVGRKDIRAMFEAFRGICAYCAVRPASQVDHFMPLARGGPHAISNLVPACGDCNRRKGPRDPFEFLHDTAERPD